MGLNSIQFFSQKYSIGHRETEQVFLWKGWSAEKSREGGNSGRWKGAKES